MCLLLIFGPFQEESWPGAPLLLGNGVFQNKCTAFNIAERTISFSQPIDYFRSWRNIFYIIWKIISPVLRISRIKNLLVEHLICNIAFLFPLTLFLFLVEIPNNFKQMCQFPNLLLLSNSKFVTLPFWFCF